MLSDAPSFLLSFLKNFRLQPEGNLFRDRFQSLQQRALVEPRVPVLCVAPSFQLLPELVLIYFDL